MYVYVPFVHIFGDIVTEPTHPRLAEMVQQYHSLVNCKHLVPPEVVALLAYAWVQWVVVVGPNFADVSTKRSHPVVLTATGHEQHTQGADRQRYVSTRKRMSFDQKNSVYFRRSGAFMFERARVPAGTLAYSIANTHVCVLVCESVCVCVCAYSHRKCALEVELTHIHKSHRVGGGRRKRVGVTGCRTQ